MSNNFTSTTELAIEAIPQKRGPASPIGVAREVEDYKPAAEFIAKYKRIWLPLHVSPDGDCLGSSLAVAHMLNQQGFDCTVVSADPIPDVYTPFLSDPATQQALGRVLINPSPSAQPPDAWVVLDCSDQIRLGSVYTNFAKSFAESPVLNIDHHKTNLQYGDINIVDTTAAAMAEQVPMLLAALDLEADAQAATWLLLGIATDTLGFRTTSTSSRTLRMAAHLMDQGGKLFRVVDEVFNQRPLSTVLLWSKAMANVKTDGRTLWTTVTRQMLRESQAKEEELEGLVSFLSGVKTIKVAALLKERGDGTRVSMRSAPGVDVSAIASVFGGGGHPQAAGCTLPSIGEAAERQLLDAIAQILGPKES